MNDGEVGGRVLPYTLGSPFFDRDVFRGQRRRPWMCFRVGTSTPEIPKEYFLKFIERVRVTLISKGLLLDEQTAPLKYTFVENDYDLFQKELEEGLEMVPAIYDKGVLSRPVVLTFIDQVRDAHDLVEDIIHHFSEHMYFIKFYPKDLLDQLNSDEYDQLENDCLSFLKFVQNLEKLPQSIAVPISLEEKIPKFEGLDINLLFPKKQTNRSRMHQRSSGIIDRQPKQEQEIAPPGLGRDVRPPVFENRDVRVSPPPGLNYPSQFRREQNYDNHPSSSRNIHAPPGISLPHPPGISVPQRSYESTVFINEIVEREYEDEHILSVSDVEAARRKVAHNEAERGMPIKKNESLMAKYINGNKLFARFNQPFVSINSNLDLLCVVNYAVSSCNKEVHPSSKAILRGAFTNGYPMKLKRKFLDSPLNTGNWSPLTVELFFEIIQLYFYTTRFKGGFMLTIDNFSHAWEELTVSYDNTSKSKLLDVDVTEREIENNRKMMNQVDKWINQAARDAHNCTVRSHDQTEDREMSYSTIRNESQLRYEEQRREELDNRRADDRQVFRERVHNLITEDRSSRCDPHYDHRGRDEVDHYQKPEDGSVGFRRDGGAVNNTVNISKPELSENYESDERSIVAEHHSSDEEQHPARPIVNTDEKPKMQYKYTEENYEPPWMKSERTEPPEDFRTLTSIPVLADYVNPEVPYLRRIQDDGIYKSAAHYLDVQFRLLREDLVSPLRDGIDIYRKNGTCQGNRIEGFQNSDILLFNVERVDGKQVTERDGHVMRVVWPSQFDVTRLLTNDREMKELGLMMLSDDRFSQDFHLAMVQTSVLSGKGCIHLAILEETGPFKPNKTYQMAQGSSYLPSYRHVLENLKNINPFKPIPFERYLVHGKKEIFRPLFHRHEKSEEQIAEEKRLETIYGEVRSVAASNRLMKNKPVPFGVDNNDDDEGFYKAKSSSKKENEEDSEYAQLTEPIFRSLTGVDSGGSDQILIGKKWYNISRLLDEYHPDNLDESQRRAFCHTFRSELSLIQGPPGTGKTHIGVQIVKTMLQNRSHWRMTEPILIVCYTNSGLDNLLERVWQMIDDDEELSKDNGKPRMIRYGRNCESELLKRRGAMRYEVHEQFRSQVPEQMAIDQRKASTQKKKKCENLVLSSYTLHCSRHKLLSYDVLSKVMDPNHQQEICQFAAEHVDSKENVLSNDEAIACWLLNRDFGSSNKMQSKMMNKKKFKGLPEDSDDEKLDSVPAVESDSEDESELDDEQLLDKLFNKMNVDCTGRSALDSMNGEVDEYYSKGPWEIVRENQPRVVMLMGSKTKHGIPTDEHIESLVKDVAEMILCAPLLKQEELEDVKYIFSLARPKRWSLYTTWCQQLRALIAENLPRQIQEYRRACQNMQKKMDTVDAEIMKMPMIIGATTSGCSRLRPLMEIVQPRILIVEEAAEVLEAHIISAMISSIEHTVMIGDHKQLRPNPAVHELGTEYGMRISMFERLAERGFPFCQLQEQHRMNTTIADLVVRTAFYENVHDAENVQTYPDVEGMATNLYFWSHAQPEETPDGVSWLNKHEAAMTASLVDYLLKQHYTASDIVVLATYAAQRVYMYHTFPSVFGTIDSPIVPVQTVDSYQGKESKIVIVSLVRSHRGVEDYTGIGFLAVANRICVALTRAQHGMYIIGNGAYLMNQSDLWRKLVKSLDKHKLVDYKLPLKCTSHNNVTLIGNPGEFRLKSPEGGCSEICNIKKECGHICQRQCHPNCEYEHRMPCDYKCNQRCPNPLYKHECTKRCYEDCGNCMILVEVTLSCGHKITTPCSRTATTQCDQLCKKTIGCGHPCQNMCGVPCSDRTTCKETVEFALNCGHIKKLKCFETAAEKLDLECVERCSERMLSCDHQCAELCGKQCTVECPEIVSVTLKCGHKQNVVCSMIAPDKSVDHIQCETIVSKVLEPCGHIGQIKCGTIPSTEFCQDRCKVILPKCQHECGDDCSTCFKTGEHICQKRCSQVLPCGHTCSAECGLTCPPCRAYCSNSCEHQSCGVGEKAFGRKCHQVCALCTENCGNKCEHQSCGKRCFEECDIRPCASLCKKLLKCGHACLGMCGEICPLICGTCDRKKYLECVADLPKAQKIHPLIMIPKCHHIFAVETLDAHVANLTASNDQLTCPKCRTAILGLCRYARYTKIRFGNMNMEKLRNNCEEHSTLKKKFNECLSETAGILDQLCKNQGKDVAKIFIDLRNHLFSLNKKFSQIPSTETYRHQFCYEIMRASLIIMKLMSSACRHRIISRRYIPPTYDVMVFTVLADNPFGRMRKELMRINEELTKSLKYEMLGATLPKLRYIIAKMSILNHFILMAQSLKSNQLDLKEADSRTIRSECGSFFDRGERLQLDVNIARIEETMLRAVPSMEKMMTGFRWKDLSVPDY